MSDELKPCPFCGGEATVESGYSRQNEYIYIQCCTCLIETQPAGDPRTAIAAWNRRSAEPSEEQKQDIAAQARYQDKHILHLQEKIADAETRYHALLDEVRIKRNYLEGVSGKMVTLEIAAMLTRIIDKHGGGE